MINNSVQINCEECSSYTTFDKMIVFEKNDNTYIRYCDNCLINLFDMSRAKNKDLFPRDIVIYILKKYIKNDTGIGFNCYVKRFRTLDEVIKDNYNSNYRYLVITHKFINDIINNKLYLWKFKSQNSLNGVWSALLLYREINGHDISSFRNCPQKLLIKKGLLRGGHDILYNIRPINKKDKIILSMSGMDNIELNNDDIVVISNLIYSHITISCDIECNEITINGYEQLYIPVITIHGKKRIEYRHGLVNMLSNK
jgi:hypothetical protein